MADLVKPGASSQKSCGKIIVKADSVKESNMDVFMRVEGRNLPNSMMCICGANNILFEIYRGSSNGQFLKVYDSNAIPDTVNPVYPPFKITG